MLKGDVPDKFYYTLPGLVEADMIWSALDRDIDIVGYGSHADRRI